MAPLLPGLIIPLVHYGSCLEQAPEPANPETGSWTPTEEFVAAGNTLIDSKDLEEQRQAARTLMEVFDTYCPGTYLYQAEDLYGIRDGLEWDMTYCENQIMPFRAGDLKVTE